MDTMRWEKIQLLRKYGQIVTEEYRDDGVAVTGYVPNDIITRFSK